MNNTIHWCHHRAQWTAERGREREGGIGREREREREERGERDVKCTCVFIRQFALNLQLFRTCMNIVGDVVPRITSNESCSLGSRTLPCNYNCHDQQLEHYLCVHIAPLCFQHSTRANTSTAARMAAANWTNTRTARGIRRACVTVVTRERLAVVSERIL